MVLSIEPCSKCLLIQLVSGSIRSEIKCVSRHSLTWFANFSFSLLHHKLASSSTIAFSLAHNDVGSFNAGRHTSNIKYVLIHVHCAHVLLKL